jgi:hypothetical protein
MGMQVLVIHSKEIKNLPVILRVNSEHIYNLNNAYYNLPSYTACKSVKTSQESQFNVIDSLAVKQNIKSPNDRIKDIEAYNKALARSISMQNLSINPPEPFVSRLQQQAIKSTIITEDAYSKALARSISMQNLSINPPEPFVSRLQQQAIEANRIREEAYSRALQYRNFM